jgi:hypothetical protein
MNPLSTMVLSLALLFGGAGAVFAFEGAAQPDAPRSAQAGPPAGAATADARPVAHPGRHHRRTVVRWAPCPGGTTLDEDVCVTDVVKTVTLPAQAAPAVSHSSSPGASSHTSGGDESHGDEEPAEGGHHGGEHDD